MAMMNSMALPVSARVDKATSHLLMGPDWGLFLDICDLLNQDVWQTKDAIKAVKKRLQNRDPKVQFFTLMLLETMMKNCGEYVHAEVANQNVLEEMVKIANNKADMQVRDKILLLIDSWQEAFGGPGSKYPQYYYAYLELKRTGVLFPQRPVDSPPIFTPPPATQLRSTFNYSPNGFGTSGQAVVPAPGAVNLSLSDLKNIRIVLDLLCDMVYALNPSDRTAAKDEVIVDLVSQCRTHQQKVMEFVSSTSNEELLKQALELNDRLQAVLLWHNAIASGTPLPIEGPRKLPASRPPATQSAPAVTATPAFPVTPAPSAPPVAVRSAQEQGEEEEDDEFAKLAQRKNKSVSVDDLAIVPVDTFTSEASSSATPTSTSLALVPVGPPGNSIEKKTQDMIDLLSITLYTPTLESSTSSSAQSSNEPPVPPQQQPFNNYVAPTPPQQQPLNNYVAPTPPQQQPFNNYIAPWADPSYRVSQTQYYPPSFSAAAPWASSGSAGPSSFPAAAAQQAPSFVAPSVDPVIDAPAAQPLQQYNSLGAQPMQQFTSFNGMAVAAPAVATTKQKAAKPSYMPDNLFGDLIDLRSYRGGSNEGGKMSRSGTMPGAPSKATTKE